MGKRHQRSQEGRVSLVGTSAAKSAQLAGEKIMGDRFGIKLEVLTGRGAELSAKINAERRAGLYLYDVYLSGIDSLVFYLKPGGGVEPN